MAELFQLFELVDNAGRQFATVHADPALFTPERRKRFADVLREDAKLVEDGYAGPGKPWRTTDDQLDTA
jgi:hypothetical protein